MGLSKREFAVLLALHDGKVASQRDVAAHADVSLGTVNTIMKKLHDEGLAEGFVLTEAGAQALEPYKVDNAIIMAAGLSSRFVPLSYERPKGVLRVRGEVLIERQIRQLQEAGITDITVVVGYMKETFFYLEDAFGVKIRVNEQYASRTTIPRSCWCASSWATPISARQTTISRRTCSARTCTRPTMLRRISRAKRTNIA